MTAEVTGGRKFTQAMSDHVFGDINGHMTAAVMYGNGMPNHLREDGAVPAPGANDFLLTMGIHRFYSFSIVSGRRTALS